MNVAHEITFQVANGCLAGCREYRGLQRFSNQRGLNRWTADCTGGQAAHSHPGRSADPIGRSQAYARPDHAVPGGRVAHLFVGRCAGGGNFYRHQHFAIFFGGFEETLEEIAGGDAAGASGG